MADKTAGSEGGSSFTGAYDTETKTARPKSVGPHDVKREQEDPADPGITPEKGYGAEIGQLNAAKNASPERAGQGAPGTHQIPEAETGDESGGTAEMLEKSGPARDAPPLRGTAGD